MDKQKSSRGGPNRGQGRKTNLAKGLEKVTWKDYSRLPVPNKNLSDREMEALKWFESLEPFERLQLIIRFYYGPQNNK